MHIACSVVGHAHAKRIPVCIKYNKKFSYPPVLIILHSIVFKTKNEALDTTGFFYLFLWVFTAKSNQIVSHVVYLI